jgi:hypothetical protein
MIRPDIRRLEGLATAAALAGIILLASQIDITTEKIRDSSLGGRISAPVTCVVPETAGDSSAASASVSEMTVPDCEISSPDLLRTAWMTAC